MGNPFLILNVSMLEKLHEIDNGLNDDFIQSIDTEDKADEESDPDFDFEDKYGRIQPEYDIIYKQDVSASDVYLQMSEKNPSSLCCNVIILQVKLPRTESASEIQLLLKSAYVKLSTNLYFLAMYLPYSIKEEESTAKWEVDTENLIITMPINRESIV